MTLAERQRTIVELWRTWRTNMRDLSDGWFPLYDVSKQIHLFHEHLQANHPHLLDMPRMDPYQQVRAWITEDMGI